jgi:2-(1,2-epoxy-1,2-dihydrophenyl)acetyl-CoA isomerase
MAEELAAAIDAVAHDDGVRVLVITGAGMAFCAGADFRLKGVRTGEVLAERAEDLAPILKAAVRGKLLNKIQSEVILGLQRLGKPSIAMLGGDAVGGGFDLCLACDLRIGSPKARFRVGYTRMGVVPDNGGSWLLPRIVGLGKALELILADEFCEAEEAYRIGLLNRLFPAEKLEEKTLELANRMAKGPPIAYRLSKTLVYKGLEMDLENSLQFLSACIPIVISSEDYKEAIRAFAEKRPPLFKGE